VTGPPPPESGPVAASPALVFVIEPYRLMANALWVRELLSHGEARRPGEGRSGVRVSGGGHLAWRGRLVPVVGLAALLGRAGSEPAASQAVSTTVDMIYGESEAGTLVSFAVDRVVGLRHLAATELRPLPPLPPEVGRLLSGIVLDPTGGPGLLRLGAGSEVLLRMWRDRPTAGESGRRS
jgi:chemotaxis signal transduction protein